MGNKIVKILSIIGARPQFVKEAIIQFELNKMEGVEEVLVHTGQHYDENMSGSFFKSLSIKEPNYNLGISGATHGKMTGEMLMRLEELMMAEEPDLVLLYGDTNSTLAGALAAAKLKIDVAHVEAGLRQEPKDMPEELNRVLTDRISKYLFVPSEYGMRNLKKEGIERGVYFTGDVMYDVFLKMKDSFDTDYYKKLGLEKNGYMIMTMHRDFNVDNPVILEPLLRGVDRIAREIPVVFPIHPRTNKMIRSFGFESFLQNVMVLEPIDYLKLMGLTVHAKAAITDSGGFQKETYFAGKRALVLMPDTSWIELVDQGVNLLVNGINLYDSYKSLTETQIEPGIYGNGDAARKIVEILTR